MKRFIALAIVAASAFGTGVGSAEPGPNGHNNYGLCKAYFAGSDNGRAHKRNAPPFQALEKAAGVDDDDTPAEIDEKVKAFCESAVPGGTTGGSEETAGTDAGATKGKGRK
jgi:hypothetical protein